VEQGGIIMSLQEKLDGLSVQDLIHMEKRITSKNPKAGMTKDGSHYRSTLELESTKADAKFNLFMRQHETFRENFSIGLDYIGSSGKVRLIRFNGAHKIDSDLIDNHHYNYHIHIEKEYEGSMNKLKYSEVTDKYYDFDSALRFALEKLNIINYLSYYPEIEQTEIELGEL
jgi:hypothetical protein